MNAPIRAERVVDGDQAAVIVTIDPANAMVSITATELTVTLSLREADALAWGLADAAEVVR